MVLFAVCSQVVCPNSIRVLSELSLKNLYLEDRLIASFKHIAANVHFLTISVPICMRVFSMSIVTENGFTSTMA